jgi:hypothetical protein
VRVAYCRYGGWILSTVPGSGIWMHDETGWSFRRTTRPRDPNEPDGLIETAWEGWVAGHPVFTCQYLKVAVSVAQKKTEREISRA